MAVETDIKKVTSKVIENLIKKEEKKYKEAGRKAMKEIRTSIVMEWFGEFHSASMIAATMYPYPKTTKLNGNHVIEVSSYIDIDKYDDKPRAERWKLKYGGSTPSKEYVLGLQLYEGIIGLPEKSNAYPEHNWVNQFFHKKEPLWNVLISDSRWSNFESYFWKYVK